MITYHCNPLKNTELYGHEYVAYKEITKKILKGVDYE
jgi:hypothetical protein